MELHKRYEKAKVRKYKDTDRSKVRKIATSTASGYPRSDLQLVADLLINYYVNHEPEHLLVAEVESKVVGYLSGCFNTSRCRWIKSIRVMPEALLKALFRGEIGLREIRYLGALVYVTIRGMRSSRPPAGYPAHFHINLAEGFRGKGIGSELVQEFFSMLREAGIGGVHVRVRQNEKGASRFFKSFGFSRQHGYPTVVADGESIKVSRSIIYTKKL